MREDIVKEAYEKPEIETCSAFEVLAAGCDYHPEDEEYMSEVERHMCIVRNS